MSCMANHGSEDQYQKWRRTCRLRRLLKYTAGGVLFLAAEESSIQLPAAEICVEVHEFDAQGARGDLAAVPASGQITMAGAVLVDRIALLGFELAAIFQCEIGGI